MQDEEVSRYVLGALRHIREEKQKEDLVDLTSWIMMSGMVFSACVLYLDTKL